MNQRVILILLVLLCFVTCGCGPPEPPSNEEVVKDLKGVKIYPSGNELEEGIAIEITDTQGIAILNRTLEKETFTAEFSR